MNGNLLLGIFEVNDMHNEVHLLSGIVALLTSAKTNWSRLYFQVFGLVYAPVAILGFAMSGYIFMMRMNMADNFLHALIAIVALYII